MGRVGWLTGYVLTAYQAAFATTLVLLQHLSKRNILWQKGFKRTTVFKCKPKRNDFLYVGGTFKRMRSSRVVDEI